MRLPTNFLSQFRVRHLCLAGAAAVIGFGLAWTLVARAAPTINGGPDVTGITESAATIRWATTEESTTEVHYGETSALGGVLKKIIPMEETEVLELMHGMWLSELKAGTTYYYRVISRAGGVTVQSDVKSFTTLSPAPVIVACTTADWSCGEWGSCAADGMRVRSCTLLKECVSSGSEKPVTQEKCEPALECRADVWDCGAWSACASAGTRTRECRLDKDCPGVDTPKPPVQDKCEPPKSEPEPVIEPKPPIDVPKEETVVAPTPQLADDEMKEEETEPEPSSVLPPPPTQPTPPREDGQRVSLMKPSFRDADLVMIEVMSDIEEVMAERVASSGSGASPLPPKPQDICSLNDVRPERCLDWIKVMFGDQRCFEVGITQRGSCERFLAEGNNGVFPGCRGKSEPECDAIKDIVLADYLKLLDVERADTMIADAKETGTLDKVIGQGMTAVRSDKTFGLGMRESTRQEGQETSAAVLILDGDGNGIPDDLEELSGQDGEAGESPTAQALMNGRPLEQPRGSGQETDEFTVDLGAYVDSSSKVGLGQLTGKCESGSVCLVYIYSYMPLVLTVTADENGDFTYDLDDQVSDGAHTVYVAVTDDTGKITRKSQPFALLVSEAQAISPDSLMTMDPVAAAQAERSDAREQRWYVYGALILVLVAGSLVGAMLLRKRSPGSEI